MEVVAVEVTAVAAAAAAAAAVDGIDRIAHARCPRPRSRGRWRTAAADDARVRSHNGL